MSVVRYPKRQGRRAGLSIRFIGDRARGNRLQAFAPGSDWRFDSGDRAPGAKAEGAHDRPDLVILDGFPGSAPARAAFYRFRQDPAVRFLALHATPGHRAFLHVSALSFIRIIGRDPDRQTFLQAVGDLVGWPRRKFLREGTSKKGQGQPSACCPLPHGALAGEACC